MSLTILEGDCLERLREMPDESVQCCVTSPPYWGLRDYGTASWEGGDGNCDHLAPMPGGTAASGLGNYANGLNGSTIASKVVDRRQQFRAECAKCGAVRVDKQIGLEKTPQAFVARMVEVFAEVRRVLKADGTCWVNLGDSYAQAGGRGEQGSTSQRLGRNNVSAQEKAQSQKPPPGLKAKDLVGIPWRVAFALQEDGWYLRSDIIWHKPNPMPESVTDRPTKAHEYLFLLTRSERYFYDAEAIREPYQVDSIARYSYAMQDTAPQGLQPGVSREKRTVIRPPNPLGRNKRDVWIVPTEPFKDAHFATFPPDLIKPCILAGSRPGDVVLDPFGGSGTTGAVAIELARRALLIELNPEYVKLIRQRCNVTPGLGI